MVVSIGSAPIVSFLTSTHCWWTRNSRGSGDYDALGKDRATDPPTVTYVQLTATAYDRSESSREEKLKEVFDKIEVVRE